MDKGTDWKELRRLIWQFLIIPSVYVLLMWSSLVAVGFLIFEDFWKSAGIISGVILFYIIRAEFNKEFFGVRNPQRIQDAVQEQSQGYDFREASSRNTERPNKKQ